MAANSKTPTADTAFMPLSTELSPRDFVMEERRLLGFRSV
jgi:hypothetical protein